MLFKWWMPHSLLLTKKTSTQYHIDIYGKHIAALVHGHCAYRADATFAHYRGDARHIQDRVNAYTEKALSLPDLTYKWGTLDRLLDQSRQA